MCKLNKDIVLSIKYNSNIKLVTSQEHMLLVVGGYVCCMILELKSLRKFDLALLCSSRLSLTVVERNYTVEKLFKVSGM